MGKRGPTKQVVPMETRIAVYADWVRTDNFAETGRRFGMSRSHVREIIHNHPDYATRQHEQLRQEFVRKTWEVCMRMLDRLNTEIPDMTAHQLIGALGVLGNRVTHAMFAEVRARTPENVTHNTTNVLITGEDVLQGIRKAEAELKDNARRGNGNRISEV